jgi:hypothetical protein
MLQDRVLEDVMETNVFVGVDVSRDSLDVASGAQKASSLLPMIKRGSMRW